MFMIPSFLSQLYPIFSSRKTINCVGKRNQFTRRIYYDSLRRDGNEIPTLSRAKLTNQTNKNIHTFNNCPPLYNFAGWQQLFMKLKRKNNAESLLTGVR